MRSFFKSCLLALSTTSIVFAQTANFDVFTEPITPGSNYDVGDTMHITWIPSSPAGKITILLLEGASNITLEADATPVASGIDSTTGTYDWLIPPTLKPFPVYGFKLQLDSDNSIFQYSTYFSVSSPYGNNNNNSSSTSVPTSTVTGKESSVSVPTTSVTPTSSLSNSSVTSAPVNKTITTASSIGVQTATYNPPVLTVVTLSTSSLAVSSSASAPLATSSTSTSTTSGAMRATVGGSGLVGVILLGLVMML